MGTPTERVPIEALLAGLGEGDAEVPVAFVRRLQWVLSGVVRAVIGDPKTAGDVAKQAFDRAWQDPQLPVAASDLPLMLDALSDGPSLVALASRAGRRCGADSLRTTKTRIRDGM